MKQPKIRFKGFTGEWQTSRLDACVDFLDNLRKPIDEGSRIKGIYPYYGASGIVDYVHDYIFDEELILLSEDGANITDRNYPVCFLASGKYWVNNHAHVLKAKNGFANSFVSNAMECKDYSQYNTGMAMPKLNKEVCKGIPLTYPSIDEQKAIASYFTNLDALIQSTTKKIESFKQVKAACLQSMFPQEGESSPRVRFKGFEGEWEKVTLGDCLIINNDRNQNNVYGINDVLSVSDEVGVVNQIKLLGRSYAGKSVSNYRVLKTNQIVYTKSPLKS
jgi:type I restriction enzyme S subunit